MPPRRERPLPDLPISLEALPPPDSKRTSRMMLSFTESEMAMIERAARARGEQPAVLVRTITLTAFQNSAMRALAGQPSFPDLSPVEQQRALLEAFAIERPVPATPAESSAPPPPPQALRPRQSKAPPIFRSPGQRKLAGELRSRGHTWIDSRTVIHGARP